MGSPLSPVSIFMEAFEHEAIESSRMKPKCWYRYVDDTSRTLEEFLQHINRQHANINFTMEIEEDGKLPRSLSRAHRQQQTGSQCVPEEDSHRLIPTCNIPPLSSTHC
ncbi:hypothetical protein Trydic_g15986 [Trypoxylus dichotomus]